MSKQSNKSQREVCVFPTEPIFPAPTTSLNFSGGTATGPGFEQEYDLIVPAGNSYSVSVRADDLAVVTGAGISVESHWDSVNKCIVPGNATSEHFELSEQPPNVSFHVSYKNNGGPYVLDLEITSNVDNVSSSRSSDLSDECLGEFVWSIRETGVNLFIKEALKQKGITDPVLRLPWEPSDTNPSGWDFEPIPPAVIYTCEDYSVRAGVGIGTSGTMSFSVDAYTQMGTSIISIGVTITPKSGGFAGQLVF